MTILISGTKTGLDYDEPEALRQLTIVSQEFHNRRSLYMAKHQGLDAIAYNAANTINRKWRLIMFLRERGSRVKAVFEVNCSN